ncbi:hypothetical protein P9112_004756 [Eukaryota sp. TZLM1-RC]
MFTSFVDKVYAGLHNDIAKAAIKATNHDDTVKEKHVRTLIIATHTNNTTEVISSLATRLSHKESFIVLKALIVLHRLLKEGSTQFISSASISSSSLLFHGSFSDPSTPESLQLSKFIRKYSIYLEEVLMICKHSRHITSSSEPLASKILTHHDEDFLSSQSSGPRVPAIELFRTATVASCSKQADYLLVLLEKLLEIEYVDIPKLQVLSISTGLLLTDCLKISSALIAYNRNVLDLFFTMKDVGNCEAAVRQYRKFIVLFDERMNNIEPVSRRYRIELPKTVSSSIIDDMELYIKNLKNPGSVDQDQSYHAMSLPSQEDQKEVQKEEEEGSRNDPLFDDLLSQDELSLFDDNFFKNSAKQEPSTNKDKENSFDDLLDLF